jgi:peptide/nickel transport system substrate-binding protein
MASRVNFSERLGKTMADLSAEQHLRIANLLSSSPDISRRRLLVLGGVGLGSLGLAACTSSGAKSSAAASTSATSPGSNGTLSVLTTSVASALDRDSSQGSTSGLGEININVQDPLVHFRTVQEGAVTTLDLTGLPGSLQPRLAESWTQVSDLKWQFKLRQGVVNNLGHEFTSADVVYTFARAMSASGQTVASAYVATTGGLIPGTALAPTATAADKTLTNQVVATGKYTVEFNLFDQTGLFPTILAVWNQYIFDSTEMKKHATASDPWSHDWCNAGNAVGFGPYYLDQLVPSSSATLKATPNYYGGAPAFTTINITATTSPSAQLAAVQAGTTDMAEGISSQLIKTLESSSTVQVVGGYTNKIIEMFVNYNYAPWNGTNTKLLRQAVAYAIPYNDILSGVYPGISRRAYSHVPSTFGGYAADMTYSTDLAKANALMSQAGFPGGKGLSQSMPGLQLYYANDLPDLATIAVYVRAALASIGIPITLQPITEAVFSTRKLVKKDLPMVLDSSDNPLIPDALYMIQTFFVPSSAGGLIDEGNYNNATVNSLTTQGFKEVGSPRDAVAAQIQQIMMGDLPAIPLAEVQEVAVVKKGITGYVPYEVENEALFQYLK